MVLSMTRLLFPSALAAGRARPASSGNGAALRTFLGAPCYGMISAGWILITFETCRVIGRETMPPIGWSTAPDYS
jgi:hypothetical protein